MIAFVLALLSAAAPGGALPVPHEAPAATAKPAPLRAPTSGEEVARDAATARRRDEMIAELEAILPRFPDGERRADLLFQEAELWWEKARAASLDEVRQHDEAVARWAELRAREPKSAGPEPRVDDSASTALKGRALALYRTVLERWPRYPRRDEVLFVVALDLDDTGHPAEAVQTFRALLREHPSSKLVPDAWVQLGEHAFAANDLEGARAAFQRAAAFHVPKLYAFSLYKLAWCDFNAGALRASIDKFQQVIAYADADAASSGARDRIQLRTEALRDLVLPYARLDALDEAFAYLEAKGGDQATDLENRLAATEFESGKFSQAVAAYQHLLARAPEHARAPAWQQKIVLSWDRLGDRAQVVGQMRRLVDRYGPASEWARAHAGDRAMLAEAREVSESALRELVQDYHQEALRTKNAATFRVARDIYRKYLDAFPEAEAAPALRFNLAEILWALEEWQPAAAEYLTVAQAGGELSRKAAYDAILALDKALAVERGALEARVLADREPVDARRVKGQVGGVARPARTAGVAEAQDEPVPALEQKVVEACDTYVRVAPGAKDEIAVRYKAALVFYEHRQFVEATRRFGDIIVKWPADPCSQKAADLSLDVLNAREEWDALASLAARFLENRRLCAPGSAFSERVARIAEGAQFKAVLALHQKGELDAAARGFRAFVERHPHSEHAPAALYDLMLTADRQRDFAGEIAAGEKLASDPRAPDAILRPALLQLAVTSERAGRYTDARRAWELAARRFPRDPHASDWRLNAALWSERLGDEAGALAAYRRWLDGSVGQPEAPQVAFGVGALLERRHDLRAAAAHWHALAEGRFGATGVKRLLARYREALALRDMGRTATAELADVGARWKTLPEGERSSAAADAAAHARFLLVEPRFEEFRRIQFHSTRQREVVAALQLKNARLQGLLRDYGEVVRIGSAAWTEAAFERLGEAYAEFNRGLLDAPLPKGLDAGQQELYRSALEQQALPLEDKAIEALRKSVEAARASGVATDWAARAQAQLRRLQPDAWTEPRRPPLQASAPLPRVPSPLAGPLSPPPASPAPSGSSSGGF